MGGPKRVVLVIVFVLLAVAAVLSIWFSTLKPEVKQIFFREPFGMSSSVY